VEQHLINPTYPHHSPSCLN